MKNITEFCFIEGLPIPEKTLSLFYFLSCKLKKGKSHILKPPTAMKH